MPVKEYLDLSYPQLDILLRELDNAGREILVALADFSTHEFNKEPFAGSWTGGQVAEHLLKSIDTIPQLLTSNTTPTTGRQPDHLVRDIEAIFLDYDTKMQSPDFILPSGGPHDRNEMLQAFRYALDGIAAQARTLDLSLTCTDFEFPGTGYLTRWEWIVFAICHTKRHARQLENIHRHLLTVPA